MLSSRTGGEKSNTANRKEPKKSTNLPTRSAHKPVLPSSPNSNGTRAIRSKKFVDVKTRPNSSDIQKSQVKGAVITKEKPNIAVPKGRGEASRNWEQLRAQLNSGGNNHFRRFRPKPSPSINDSKTKMLKNTTNTNTSTNTIPKPKSMIPGFPTYDHTGKIIVPTDPNLIPPVHKKPTWCLAMDCEMVGVGPMKESALARVSIVNEHGYCLYDKFVKPKVKITDYRTEVSGIREEDMKNAENFDVAIQEVSDLLRGHVIVGHAIHHDFRALLIRHSRSKIRDTSVYFRPVFKRTPSLKGLAEKLLNLEIQTGEHNSIIDAQVTMKLYLNHRREWEEQILANKSRAKNHNSRT